MHQLKHACARMKEKWDTYYGAVQYTKCTWSLLERRAARSVRLGMCMRRGDVGRRRWRRREREERKREGQKEDKGGQEREPAADAARRGRKGRVPRQPRAQSPTLLRAVKPTLLLCSMNARRLPFTLFEVYSFLII